jgi:hypothetical protein
LIEKEQWAKELNEMLEAPKRRKPKKKKKVEQEEEEAVRTGDGTSTR